MSEYNFKGFSVRSGLEQNGNIWFVAKDVCDVLELGNVSKAVSHLADEDRGFRFGVSYILRPLFHERGGYSKSSITRKVSYMNKESLLSELQRQLEETKIFASIIYVTRLTDMFYDYRKLLSYCKKHNLGIKKVRDSRYGYVNAYPAKAWKIIYGINLKKLP